MLSLILPLTSSCVKCETFSKKKIKVLTTLITKPLLNHHFHTQSANVITIIRREKKLKNCICIVSDVENEI